MKVLIACEYSGKVRDAFIKQGHDAVSCDLLPTDQPGPHYQGNVLDIINDGYDLMIAHPPCTYLAVSGMHWTTRGLRDPQLTEDALTFVSALLNAPIDKIALENPISIISSRIRRPDQIIQPWQFGHDASKQTCLWLKNLPKLSIVTPKMQRPFWYVCSHCEDYMCRIHDKHVGDCECPTLEEFLDKNDDPYIKTYGNQTKSGQNKLPPSKDRWKLRSTTYQGIADAMAKQWSIKE